MNKKSICFIVLFSLLNILAFSEDFSFSATVMTGAMTKGREKAVLSGKAKVISGEMTINADKIELYGTDYRFVECTGNVLVIDNENGMKLTTSNLFYDRQSKLTRMTGPSVMEDKKNKIVIKGDFIENDDEKKLAIIQINIRILKDNLLCKAEFAHYDRNANTLELTGSPVVKRDNDDYRAALIRVNLDTEDIIMEGSVSGTVSAAKKDAQDSQKSLSDEEKAKNPTGSPDSNEKKESLEK